MIAVGSTSVGEDEVTLSTGAMVQVWHRQVHAAISKCKKICILFLTICWETPVFFPQIPAECLAIQEVVRWAQESKRKNRKQKPVKC